MNFTTKMEASLVHWGPDEETIAKLARVSYGSSSGDLGILSYLIRHNEMKPFEKGQMILECAAPLYVLRHVATYRHSSRQEQSGRYTHSSRLYYLPNEQLKKKFQDDKEIVATLATALVSIEYYQDKLIELGLTKQRVRMLSPQCAMHRFNIAINAREAMLMFDQRLAKGVQGETIDFFKLVWERFREAWPFIAVAYAEKRGGDWHSRFFDE